MTYIKYGQISTAKESKEYDISLFNAIIRAFALTLSAFPFENNRKKKYF